MTKPTDVKVYIWILDEHIEHFLEGNYDVVWCEERKDLSGTWNHFVQLSILPSDYFKLKATRDGVVDDSTNQLKIPF